MTVFRHPLTEFRAAARPRCELWCTALGITLTFALVIIMSTIMRMGADAIINGLDGTPEERLRSAFMETARQSNPTSFLINLAMFACHWPALWIVLRLVHKRPGRTLWGPKGRIDWFHYRVGLAASLALGAAAWLPWLHLTENADLIYRPLKDWIPMLLIGLPLIFVQSAAEELMFRGYMLQQFAARSWSIIGWSVIPSVIFAALHPGEGQPLGLNWLSLVFGLVMAAITSRTANLGAAAGMHFGHNVINALIISSIATGAEPALIGLGPGVNATQPVMIFVVLLFLGSIVYMGQMDLKFILAWRADPSRKGQPPVRLVLPLDEKWVARREARKARRKAREAAREATRLAREEREHAP